MRGGRRRGPLGRPSRLARALDCPLLPYSPLVSQMDPALLGRLSLPTTAPVVVAVMAGWLLLGLGAVTVRRSLHPVPG